MGLTNGSFSKFLIGVAIAVIVAQFVMGATLIWIVNSSLDQRARTEQIAQDNLRANCIDLRVTENRITTTTAILKVVPGPTPVADISRSVLERGLARDREFYEAKDFLQDGCMGVAGLPEKITQKEAEIEARDLLRP